MATFFPCIPWHAASAIWKRSLVNSTQRPCSRDWCRSRLKAGVNSLTTFVRLDGARPSAGNFRRTAGTIDAADGSAVGRRIARDVEIRRLARFRRQLRILDERKPRNPVEWRFGFAPFDACVLGPEIGITGLAPIGHLAGVEKLNGKVELAHPAILRDVPGQFVLQAFRIVLLQSMRWIVRRGYGRKLDRVVWPVTKRNRAPVAELLIRSD